MLEIQNRSPFGAALVPGRNTHGLDFVTLVVKGTFDIDSELTAAEEQVPIVYADEHYAEPEDSSVRIASDVLPATGATEVALIGHAYADESDQTSAQVEVAVGPIHKSLRISGDRVWSKTLGVLRTSTPMSFERIPLTWERAYGGRDTSHRKQEKHDWERCNPVGRGFAVRKSQQLDGLPLPNIEDPSHLLTSPPRRPPPAGLGFIGPDWQPRVGYAGTYDESWEKERCPLLPLDFDERFYHCVPPDRVVQPALRGGEPVYLRGVAREGPVAFELPEVDLRCAAALKGERVALEPVMERVLLEPDEKRVVINWKATVHCGRSLPSLASVRIVTPGLQPAPPPQDNVVELRPAGF